MALSDGEPPTGTGPLASSIDVTKRRKRSIRMLVVQGVLRPLRPLLLRQTKFTGPGSPQLEAPKKVLKSCEVRERMLNGIRIYDIVPKPTCASAASSPKPLRQLYWFAGGGWQLPASSEHWKLCAGLAGKLRDTTTISLVSYPLSPNNSASTCFSTLLELYINLLHTAHTIGQTVVLAGDSAGGNVVLSLMMAALSSDESAPSPHAVLAMCPSTDLRRTNPAIKALAPRDPLLTVDFICRTAEQWRGEWEADDPRVSPLCASDEAIASVARRDIRVHGITGGFDILAPDAVLFRNRLARLGVQGKWLAWERMIHCWPLTQSFTIPEGRQATDWIVDVLKET